MALDRHSSNTGSLDHLLYRLLVLAAFNYVAHRTRNVGKADQFEVAILSENVHIHSTELSRSS
jgi:hypothetical protein